MSQQNSTKPNPSSTGVLLIGLDRPAMLNDLLQEVPPMPTGYSAPIYLIDPDRTRAKSFESLTRSLDPTRFHIFSGDQCAEDLIGFLGQRLDRHLPRKLVVSGSHHASLARHIASEIETLVAKQATHNQALRTRVEQIAQERGLPFWNDRYQAILGGSSARVLIVTTHYSTYLNYICADLADALRDAGHEPMILKEQDTHTALTHARTLEALLEFDPDLTVMPNFPRVLRDEFLPEGVPNLCWVQDSMSHLFAPLPAPPSQLDFIAGHIYDTAPAIMSYPEEARLAFPVPISENKFNTEPIDQSQLDRFSCDIAYVSHQSIPADRFHAQFIQRLPVEQRSGLERIRERLEQTVQSWSDQYVDSQLQSLRAELAECFGHRDDRAVQDMLWGQYLHPMLERMLRHQMLAWAAQIADRHGLTMHLYGRGWEQHPTLARFARGEIEHGDSLRACYQAARVHLHASSIGCGHQRVFECAMSGGLTLSLRSWDEFYRHNWHSLTLFLQHAGEPDVCDVQWKHAGYLIKNHPELARLIAQRDRFPRPDVGWDHELLDQSYMRPILPPFHPPWDAPPPPPQLRPLDLLADPFETTFSGPDDLEKLILKAVRDSQWRTSQSHEIASRARETISMRIFAQSVLRLVADRTESFHALEPSGALL